MASLIPALLESGASMSTECAYEVHVTTKLASRSVDETIHKLLQKGRSKVRIAMAGPEPVNELRKT